MVLNPCLNLTMLSNSFGSWFLPSWLWFSCLLYAGRVLLFWVFKNDSCWLPSSLAFFLKLASRWLRFHTFSWCCSFHVHKGISILFYIMSKKWVHNWIMSDSSPNLLLPWNAFGSTGLILLWLEESLFSD